MPETCSCGAQLPPDALFCHKCGKPQREILPADPAEPESAPVTIVPPPAFDAAATPQAVRFAMPVGFRNPVALRIALLVGVGATLVGIFVPLVNWLAAGFFAVFLYRRKTHNLLNVGAGMRLGWITGLVMFTMWGITFLAQGLSGKLAGEIQDQIKILSASSDPYMQQVAHTMGNATGTLIVLMVPFVFVVITCLSVAGGALGAKLVGRD